MHMVNMCLCLYNSMQTKAEAQFLCLMQDNEHVITIVQYPLGH